MRYQLALAICSILANSHTANRVALARRGGPELIVNTDLFDLSQFFHRIHTRRNTMAIMKYSIVGRLVFHVPGQPLKDGVGTEGAGPFAEVIEQTLLLGVRSRGQSQHKLSADWRMDRGSIMHEIDVEYDAVQHQCEGIRSALGVGVAPGAAMRRG